MNIGFIKILYFFIYINYLIIHYIHLVKSANTSINYKYIKLLKTFF